MGHCKKKSPEELILAIKQFNDRKWFECHETLEDIWLTADGETRDLYQGILQVAVALHHWSKGNFGGAMSLLKTGVDHLSQVSPVCQQVDVAGLIHSADAIREALGRLGRDRMGELEATLIPRLQRVK
jgi:uncharacterized protein